MGKNLTGKTVAILAILVVFTYGIFYGTSTPTAGSPKQLLAKNIQLGLDLRGGTHLVLQVMVNEAVAAVTDNDVARIEGDLQKAGITGATVGKTDPAHVEAITVSNIPTGKLNDVRSALDNSTYGDYDLASQSDGSLKVTMKQAAVRAIETRTLDTSIETIRDRVDVLGVAEPVIQKFGLGDNEILVELPGIDDSAQVESSIQSTSRLEIHQVVNDNGSAFASEQEALAANGGAIPPDAMLVHGKAKGNTPDSVYLLKRVSVVAGNDFRDAQQSTDEAGRPDTTFTLTTAAGERFFAYTSANIGKFMAIEMNNQVVEVASINGAIRDSGRISGGMSKDEAAALSLTLRTGALPASVKYLETRTVGPSLGADSIRQGVIAAIAGMAAVMLFMLLYYRGAGINADLALMLNLVILLGFMGFFHSTLTLPGIAGVILTIGMGVDSNVLIFERIREELHLGKTAASAVDQGFKHALTTIIDTHVTTIVSAGILFIFGTGPVRGFAVTLTFGLLANLFTAVFVSRVIFDAILQKKERGAALSI